MINKINNGTKKRKRSQSRGNSVVKKKRKLNDDDDDKVTLTYSVNGKKMAKALTICIDVTVKGLYNYMLKILKDE